MQGISNSGLLAHFKIQRCHAANTFEARADWECPYGVQKFSLPLLRDLLTKAFNEASVHFLSRSQRVASAKQRKTLSRIASVHHWLHTSCANLALATAPLCENWRLNNSWPSTIRNMKHGELRVDEPTSIIAVVFSQQRPIRY